MVYNPRTSAVYWRSGRATLVDNETGALEACEFFERSACRLVISNNSVIPKAPLVSSARLAYGGEFDWKKVPAIQDGFASSSAVAGYGDAPGMKAMAIHFAGTAYTATAKTTQAEAENAALDACSRANPSGEGGACFIYASGNKVVLNERRTKAAQ